MEEGPRDRETLPHSAGELAHKAVLDALETGALQPFESRAARVRELVQLPEEDQVFKGGSLPLR